MNEATAGPHIAAWRRSLLVLALCLAWILYWYWDTAAAMVTIWWRSETFAHAFLVPPISFWLIWRRRKVLAEIEPRISPAMTLPLALAGFAWLLGDLAAVNAVTQFALVAMLVLAVATVLGTRVSMAMLFPLGFLFFAVPIGEFVMPQFMQWTADFTVTALRASGVPVYREGTHFIIPSGSWSVVEACSGVRYLIASVVVGTLYAYLSYRSLWKRLIFICASIIVPIIANWLRAYMIVMLGHLSGNRIAVGVDHLIYGWVFFGIVMVLMYMVGARWAEDTTPNEQEITTQPVAHSLNPYRPWLAAAIVLAIAWLPQAWDQAIGQNGTGTSPRLALPVVENWQVASSGTLEWQPAFAGASADLRAVFEREGAPVGLFIGYYRQQDYDHKLVSSNNVLVKSNDREWAQVSDGSRSVVLAGHPVTVRQARLKGEGGRRLVAWQWYWINGRLTSNDYVAKAWTAWSSLTEHGDDSAVIVVFAPDDDRTGEIRLQGFVQSAVGNIDATLVGARNAARSGTH